MFFHNVNLVCGVSRVRWYFDEKSRWIVQRLSPERSQFIFILLGRSLQHIFYVVYIIEAFGIIVSVLFVFIFDTIVNTLAIALPVSCKLFPLCSNRSDINPFTPQIVSAHSIDMQFRVGKFL